MADGMYDGGRQRILEGSIAILTDTIKAILVSTAYTVNLGTHVFYSDLTNVLNAAQTLASKTSTAGVFNAANITFTAVAAGSTVGAVIIYKDTGVAGTSPLIAYIDGKRILTLAANAANAASSLTVDPLPVAIPAATPITFVTSTFTATCNATAAGLRTVSLSVNLNGATTAGDTAVYNYGAGLPVTTNNGNISVTWDSGSNKIWKL